MLGTTTERKQIMGARTTDQRMSPHQGTDQNAAKDEASLTMTLATTAAQETGAHEASRKEEDSSRDTAKGNPHGHRGEEGQYAVEGTTSRLTIPALAAGREAQETTPLREGEDATNQRVTKTDEERTQRIGKSDKADTKDARISIGNTTPRRRKGTTTNRSYQV